MVHFLFFVDQSTREVDAVYCISPYGITVRRGSDWHHTTIESSSIFNRQESIVYELDWDKVPVPEGEVDFLDPEALQLYDKGGLTENTLKNYANPIYSGTGQKDYEAAVLSLYVGDLGEKLFKSYGWVPFSVGDESKNDDDVK